MADNMFDFFVFRDKRLKGDLPLSSTTILAEVDASTPLSNAFDRLTLAAKTQGKGGKLKGLFILAHGMGTGDLTGSSDFWWKGGTGVMLGQEDLTAANVVKWSAIKNTVDYIVVYACGAAYTGHPVLSPQTVNDGQSLMSDLARHTNAIVYAADRIQWYTPGSFDFGRWEGTVYMFLPGGVVIQDFRPPTEVHDVIAPKRAVLQGFG